MNDYHSNCDFIRKRFNLREDVSIYEIVNICTEFIKNTDKSIDNNITIEKSQEEKKRGRPKKRTSS